MKSIRSLLTALALSILSFQAAASPVNVNTASVEEISSALKGIGPAKAQAISDFCQQKKCTTAEDLLQVKGIGEKTLAKISADLQFE
ncbi:ComEA family DNA-binding protein [Thiomicrorhabdus sediminis]|uniref:Helix-hairpin-helix domain-containing protein n=1 Tax=Thiomicrorhabdus sediminis TaxID=2580412 RepID=A0A4P9K3U0_9GAMM|nr:helix-hairpin-helix domain-containing protein [Thiomicrorhabdus sediminis]QCU89572.1 helix-hairpin-helix domain-containing protein [Thiomicrorhabdus sediminis]